MNKFNLTCKSCGEEEYICISYDDNIKYSQIYIYCENCGEEECIPKDYVEDMNSKIERFYVDEDTKKINLNKINNDNETEIEFDNYEDEENIEY